MGIGFIPDLIIDNKLILELKSVENLAEVHYQTIAHLSKIDKTKIRIANKFQRSVN
jgi:hypothetical protein